MRVISRETCPSESIGCDLKLIQLANKMHPESSEECLIELSQALSTALEVIERSLQ